MPVNIGDIRTAITNKNARWSADGSSAEFWSRLDRETKKRFLGVNLGRPVDPNNSHPFPETGPLGPPWSKSQLRLALIKNRKPGVERYRRLARFSGFRHHKGPVDLPGGGGPGIGHNEYLQRFQATMLRAAKSHLEDIKAPEKVDWREANAVTEVKNQGACGSCVAFGAVATLESMALIEQQKSLDLSEADLFFCGSSVGSCDSGWTPDEAINELISRGVVSESCLPYSDAGVDCSLKCDVETPVKATNREEPISDMAERKEYLANVGPMMCCLAVYEDFFAYASGVYSVTTGEVIGYH
jgi:hypothetical protein